MLVNPHKSEVGLVLDGEQYILRFSWDGLARLDDEFGSRYDRVITEAATAGNVRVLAKVLAVGLEPPLTPERIMELSPPVEEVSRSILTALSSAVWGKAGPPVSEEEDEKGAENPQIRKTWWQRLGDLLSGLVGRRANSGQQPHMS